jgi:hypothetical protein
MSETFDRAAIEARLVGTLLTAFEAPAPVMTALRQTAADLRATLQRLDAVEAQVRKDHHEHNEVCRVEREDYPCLVLRTLDRKSVV